MSGSEMLVSLELQLKRTQRCFKMQTSAIIQSQISQFNFIYMAPNLTVRSAKNKQSETKLQEKAQRTNLEVFLATEV